MALNIHFIFNINQWEEMRHADRSCLSDTFYQNLKLGAWQQSHVTKYPQDEQLHLHLLSELNDYCVHSLKMTPFRKESLL